MALDKLVDSAQLDSDLTSVANAIRTKGGTSASLSFPAEFVSAIGAIQTETAEAEEKDVNFYDYDGTRLYSYSASDFASLSAMPSNPTHTGLTAQGWNWTLADAKTYVADTGMLDIGQMYAPSDGKTHLYITMLEGRCSPCLGFGLNGTCVIDWGDGSATDTVTGTSIWTVVTATHTYTPGEYVISLSITGTLYIFGGSGVSYLFRKSNDTTSDIHCVYSNAVKKIEIGPNVRLGFLPFKSFLSLKSVTLPHGMTSLDNQTFTDCKSLRHVTFPSGMTSIGGYTFYGCVSLETYSLPQSITSYGAHMCNGCQALKSACVPSAPSNGAGNFYSTAAYSLSRLALPTGLTSIVSTFDSCKTLPKVVVPSTVTSISGFKNCYGLAELHFKPATPPTASNSNTFQNLPTDCVIYVPTGKLSAYTSATNYPSSGTYTYVEE